MSITSVTDLVVGVAAVLGSVFSITSTLIGLRNTTKIQEVHVSVNSQLTEWKKENSRAERAEGRIEGRDETVAKPGLAPIVLPVDK